MTFWLSMSQALLWCIIIIACCHGNYLEGDDNDDEQLVLKGKPQVADLKRFEPSFPASNDSQKDTKIRKKLVVSTLLEAPFVMLKKDSYIIPGNDRFEGFLVDLLRHFSQSLNFDYEIRLVSKYGNNYGSIIAERFSSGALLELHRKEAQIAMGAIVITNDTKKFVDFTDPLLTLRYSALIAKPKLEDKNSNEDDLRIKDVSQLLASRIPCGVVRESVVHKMLVNSKLPIHQAVMATIAYEWPKNFVANRQEGVDRARSENYAFIVDTPIAEYEAGKQPCDLYTTEPFLDLVEYGLALTKDLEFESDDGKRRFKEAIDDEIASLKRGDDMQAMYLHWWRDECTDVEKKSEEDDDYHVIEWTSNEHKGQKSTKVRNEGFMSIQGRTGYQDTTMHHQDSNTNFVGYKSQQRNRSASRRYHSSTSSSNFISTVFMIYPVIVGRLIIVCIELLLITNQLMIFLIDLNC